MASSNKQLSPYGPIRTTRRLPSPVRQVIYNVHKYLVNHKAKHQLQLGLIKSTAEATGVSIRTVHRILEEGKRAEAAGITGQLFSRPKTNQGGHNKIELTPFIERAIRRKIHEFYIDKKEWPTINKLVHFLNEDGILHCKREYLRLKLNEFGFKWKKCQNNRKLLIENPEIVASRMEYLKQIKTLRNEQRSIVYLDETYLYAGYTTRKSWKSEEEVEVTVPITKGSKLTIIHAGGSMGFLKDVMLICNGKLEIEDYSEDTSNVNLKTWTQEQLIPNLPDDAVIVIGNAPFQGMEKNKKPTSVSLKKEMYDWLTKLGIGFSPELSKAELLGIINSVSVPKDYILDDFLCQHGYTVLRIPPYHPDLNPIELVWGDIKGKVDRVCLTNTLEEKKKYFEHCVSEFTIEEWKACCKHVEKIEDEYIMNDKIMDERLDQMIMQLGESTTASDSSDDS